MPIGNFFYVARNCEDGKVAVDFYADRETAQLACDIEAKGGNPVTNNKPQEIELDFSITGALLTPDATADELRRKLDLMTPPKPAAPAPVVAETETDSSRPARQFNREAAAATAAADAAAASERQARELADKIPSLDGKVIAFSGKMSMSRPRIKEYARQLGARVAGAVTENTDILVVGEDAGLKLERANEMGITIITEAQWNDLALRCDNDNQKKQPKASFGI